jgi:hypothetical protein
MSTIPQDGYSQPYLVLRLYSDKSTLLSLHLHTMRYPRCRESVLLTCTAFADPIAALPGVARGSFD